MKFVVLVLKSDNKFLKPLHEGLYREKGVYYLPHTQIDGQITYLHAISSNINVRLCHTNRQPVRQTVHFWKVIYALSSIFKLLPTVFLNCLD